MPFAEFRKEINYVADPKGFMKLETDPEQEMEEVKEFMRQNVEFMKGTQKSQENKD